MPIKRETGKDRWRRVPKDYFKTRDRLQGAKLQLSAVALVLAVGWAALGFDWTGRKSLDGTDLNSLRANHGTLARVHASWDQKCDACHVPFEPIDGRALFASRSSSTNRSSDQLCATCHAGPSHHAASIESEVKGCAECHRDHQGRDFSLVRLADNECTNCHGNLDAHLDPSKKPAGSRSYEKRVALFNATDHPAFSPEAATRSGGKLVDRGKLKFNHARHMMPGIVREPGDSPYTVDQIPIVAERARYQGKGSPADPVRLECGSCHQLDSTEVPSSPNPAVGASALPARSAGRYYLPMTFEVQCRACHSLSFDPRTPELEVPHGVQPDQVVAFVKRAVAAQVLSDDPKLLDVFVPAARIPGKAPALATATNRRDEALGKALTYLFPAQLDPASTGGKTSNANNCLECHHYGPERSEGYPTRVEATKVPEIWFTHASFDHSSHRGVDCRECHAGSYALERDGKTINPTASKTSADVLLPAIDNCVQCHAPAQSQGIGGWFAQAGSSSGGGGGGAGFACTECHKYHNGDRPLQGYAAKAQDASIERSIAEFLRGTAAAKSPSP